jgi:spore coat polysaccharide biosynthesis protein SpsF
VQRVLRARTIDKVVVATTTRTEDDAVAALAEALRVAVHRGDAHDVLGRYLEAATAQGIDLVVRVSGDCPLIDPDVIDLVVSHLLAQPVRPDYASNTWPRSVPLGLDTEVFSLEALRRSAALARAPREREHVTLHMKEHPETYRLSPVTVSTEGLDLRWTVDEPADLALVRAIYRELGGRIDAAWGEVLDLVRRRPDLRALNAHVSQRAP